MNKNYIKFKDEEIKKIPTVVLKSNRAQHMSLDYGDMKEYDYFQAIKETKTHFIGSWCTGLGFFDVQFPKSNVKFLNIIETLKFGRMKTCMNGNVLYKNDYIYWFTFRFLLFRFLFFIPYNWKAKLFKLGK